MRNAIVIGAGLAGAAVCERLCSRGWHVSLIERHARPAAEASGNHAGSIHPLLARDDNHLARLTQFGVALALDSWRELETAGWQFGWQACGVLQLTRAEGKADPAAALGGRAVDCGAARVVTRAEASDIAGVLVADGGVFFESAGWVQPVQLVQAQLARCAATRLPQAAGAASGSAAAFVAHYGRTVAVMRCIDGLWEALDDAGAVIARAGHVVVAGGASVDAARWFAQSEWPVELVRGRLTVIDAALCQAPRVPVHRDGYVLPAIDGRVVAGASYERTGVSDPPAADRANLRRLAALLGRPDLADLTPLPESRSAARAVARDRVPMIGALPDCTALSHVLVTRKGAALSDLPRLPGVFVAGAYGSRGLTWAALGAQVLACMMEHTAAPLDGALLNAIDPARFAFRALRRAPG